MKRHTIVTMNSLHYCAVFLALFVLHGAYSERIFLGSEQPIKGRFLASSDTDELLDDAEMPQVYQQVSSNIGPISYSASPQGWAITYVNASIELDTEATYSDNFNLNNPGTWEPGTSRFNVTVTLQKTSGGVISGSVQSPAITALLHTVVCGGDNWANSSLASNNSGIVTASPAAAFGLNLSSSGTISGSSSNLTNSTIYNFLVDYDKVQSVVVYGNGNILACQNLRPPFPDFPADWSATIETTDVDRGFTYVYAQTYSQTLNKIRLDVHSYGTDRIIVTDPSSGQTTIVTPSNGTCQSRNFGRGINWITEEDNSTLLSTAEMLHFTKANNVTYLPGFQSVRGIPCEVWQTSVSFSGRRFNMSFDVQYYFPVNQWLVGREDYHRLLKRVYMNGTRNGEPFEAYDEYVNFRPRTVYSALFDVCGISPYGKNCNCTDKLRRQAYANISQALDTGDALSVNGADAAACAYGGQVPHGFIRAQSGPYVGLTIVGMIGGSMITGAAMYLFYRKRVGVRISDNLGHQKFSDAPGS